VSAQTGTSSYVVAAEGTDGALWVRTDLSNWTSLGGALIAAPAVAALPLTSGSPVPLYIVTTTNHTLWERTATTNWTMLGPAATYCINNPSAVVTGSAPGTLTVTCEGGDQALYSATMAVPSSGLPNFSTWTDLGGALGAGPAVAPVNGVITYFVTAGFNAGQVWARTAATSWDPLPQNFHCLGQPAAGIAQSGTTTWFGCEGADGELWAGLLSDVVPEGGAINPGTGLGITSSTGYMFAEANFGGDSVWMRTPAANWVDLGGSVVNGVGAVGMVSAQATATCVTSDFHGFCPPTGSYTDANIVSNTANPGSLTVSPNVWGPISGETATLYANGPTNWYTTFNVPAGNTSVTAFPNVGMTYNEQPLSDYTSLTSSFSENENVNPGTDGWAAYDNWFNNYGNEVMIQLDFANGGNGPCGDTTGVYDVQFGGSNGVPVQDWQLCQFGSEIIWQLSAPGTHNLMNEQSGSVDILAMTQWLETHGYLPTTSTITGLSFGWEICSTGGVPENFQMNNFTIAGTT
jgi:hypothetical protein